MTKNFRKFGTERIPQKSNILQDKYTLTLLNSNVFQKPQRKKMSQWKRKIWDPFFLRAAVQWVQWKSKFQFFIKCIFGIKTPWTSFVWDPIFLQIGHLKLRDTNPSTVRTSKSYSWIFLHKVLAMPQNPI